MTVRELIKSLMDFNMDAVVLTYDGDLESMETITGFVYGGADNTVELCTDDMGG